MPEAEWPALMEGSVMARLMTVTEWMEHRGLTMKDLITSSAMDEHVVKAIAERRYTPSPEQRWRLAAALGIQPEQVAWDHINKVEHLYGHGPQFGRSP
jgi:ribosome-binding protein aMBF1 (putative translation factor)